MMRYDDDKYIDHGDDNDLWDDELEINSGDSPSARNYLPDQSFAPNDSYATDPSSDSNDIYEGNRYEDDDTAYKALEQHDDDHYADSESEPEPEVAKKPKRKGFFRKRVKEETEDDEEEEDEEEEDDDDDDNDYFDDNDHPVKVKKKKKAPKLDPEDPDYWMGEEEQSPFTGMIHKPSSKWKWMLALNLILLLLLVFSWMWFLRPHTDSAIKYGYILNMERRGSLIKTFEGTMIPYKELGDPNPLYFDKLNFSVESDSLAAAMKRLMLRSVPVRVEYKEYHTPLPWKGEENMVIVKVDSADPRKILPPEYR